MTKAELETIRNDIIGYNDEIKRINDNISKLDKGAVSSGTMSGMPHGTNISNPTAEYTEKKECLELKRKKQEEELEEYKEKAEEKMQEIEDSVTRGIIKRKYIDLMNDDKIAEKTNYSIESVFSKLRKYFKENT